MVGGSPAQSSRPIRLTPEKDPNAANYSLPLPLSEGVASWVLAWLPCSGQ